MLSPWVRAPRLDWIQVEVSSRCNADCIYCPRHTWRGRWQSRLLPAELYRQALGAVRTRLVHLQGWGEPLTHPSLADMIRSAHTASRFVGTTTNGMLLTRDRIEELVDAGLDLLAFSFAGVDETNDAIRRGTRIATVRRAIDELHAVKARLGSRTPHVHVAYMLLRSRRADIEALAPFFGELGAEQAVVSSLALVVDPALADEAVLARDERELSELRARLSAVRDDAAKRGCDVHAHVVVPFGGADRCSENVTRSAVVTSRGDVGPCVIGQVPVAGAGSMIADGQERTLPVHRFGHLADASLATLWRSRAFTAHRAGLGRGDVPAGCRGCYKLRIQDLREPAEPA
jgi:MoaA/NifB/PqqE/SkfB family radical SAM enzyme